jgi:membrane-associated protease RseP (regulator of RpoE activity)
MSTTALALAFLLLGNPAPADDGEDAPPRRVRPRPATVKAARHRAKATTPAKAVPVKASPAKAAARAERPWLGVTLGKLTPPDRRQKGIPRHGGVVVLAVLKASPAAQAGFTPGDVIMRLDNGYVYGPEEVIRKVAGHKPGDRVKIDIIRNGKWMMARVRLQPRPAHAATQPAEPEPPAPRETPEDDPPRPAVKAPAAPPKHAVATRIEALEREIRLLRRTILDLRGVCRPR